MLDSTNQLTANQLTANQPTEDQLAIAEYFASPEFAKAGQRGKEVFVDRRPPRLIDHYSLDIDSDRGLSVGMAFWGLGSSLLLVGMAFPYLAWFLSDAFNRNFAVWMTLIQFAFAPLLAVLTLISATAAFWYVDLWRRFALALLVTVPGLAMVFFGMIQMDLLSWSDLIPAAPLSLMAFCVAVGTVILPIQMWSRWSLSHASDEVREMPSMGTRTIMELTLIASAVFAFGLLARSDDLIFEMLVAIIVGAMSACAMLSLALTRLRRDRRGTWFGVVMSLLFSSAAMFLMSLHAFSRYEETIAWFAAGNETTVVAATSIVGTSIFYICLEMGRWWLRACGWQCVDRREAAQADDRLVCEGGIESDREVSPDV